MGKYSKLPHDDWYDDWTWSYILDASNHLGSRTYSGAEDFDPDAVAEIVHWYVREGSWGPEHDAVGVFRMDDDTYVVYTGMCDSTGWGCQDDARFTYHYDRSDAERFGLGDEERRWLNITLPDNFTADPVNGPDMPTPLNRN